MENLIKLKKMFPVICLVVFSFKSLSQQAYVFPDTTSKVSYHGTLIQILMDNDNTIDTTKFDFTTELTNIYSSKKLKIVKCVNMPIFIEFDKEKIIRGQFNTYYLAIASDSIYNIVNYNDEDVNKVLKLLLSKKDRESEVKFIKLPITLY